MAERERWSSRKAFVLAAIGSAVGLGNVWRFPYVAYANGGGAFFIPYLVALITAGIPLMILELGVGHMMQGSAPESLRKANPHGEWVGWFALLVGTVISVYYAVLMAYACEYLVYSFHFSMPWSDPELVKSAAGKLPEEVFFADRIRDSYQDPLTGAFCGFREMWKPALGVVAGLAVTWLSVYVIICRGVRRVGKVVWVTVPLPWIMLLILMVRGLTLEGAASGVAYYLRPDFAALKNPSTWLAAYGQVFFSLSLGFGVMIAYASYLPRKADITNNAFIVSFADTATSFFAGFAVFSVLGFLAHSLQKPIGEVVSSGPGLAFVTYPRAISLMPTAWRPVVAVSFFVMLWTLGIDSLFSLVEAAVTGLHDRWPRLSAKWLTAALSVLGFGVGVAVFANRAGLRWLDIFDHWANDYGLVIVGLLECVVIGYLFKTEKLHAHVNSVSEINLWGWWEFCVKFLTPLVLIYLIGANFLSELTQDSLYGAGAAGDPFNGYVWVAPTVFAMLFLVAFALARNWAALGVAAGGLGTFGLLYAYLRAAGAGAAGMPLVSPAILGAIGAALVMGGLILCLRMAARSGGGISPDGFAEESPTPVAGTPSFAAGEEPSVGSESPTPLGGTEAVSGTDSSDDTTAPGRDG